jgi:hypothetical protein
VARPARPMLPVAFAPPAVEELLELGSLSYDDAAAHCGISRREINRAVERGELKPFHHKGGKKPLIPKRALIRWQAEMYATEHNGGTGRATGE